MFKFCIYSQNNNAGLVGTVLSKRGNWEEVERTDENKTEIFTTCNFIWKPTNLSTAGYNKLDQAARSRPKDFIQVFNHFENLYGLCTKTGLLRSLRKYYSSTKEAKQIKYNVYDSTPTSFLVNSNLTEYEYSLFASRFQEIAKQDFSREVLPQKHCTKNFWLVKPADQNQGRGIEVFNKLHEIEEFLTSKTIQSFWVIQKYLEKPLLYHGRKFDIRMWAFVTAKNEVFLYRKGYLRTSSEEFDLKNSNNYVHLTNNCLQKHAGNYGQHEEGNTLPLETLDAYFAQLFPDLKPTVATHIMPRIRDLVIDTILATKRELNPLNRKNAFEFLGYDFMIDEDLRTWLIEANTNPYIGVPTEYIGGLLNVMLDDLLRIVVDPLLPPQEAGDGSRPNNFELLYCENGSAYHNGSMNLRTPFKKNVYPAQELVPEDVTKKLSLLEKGPEPVPNQPKFKVSRSLKALKSYDNREKVRELKTKEKIENQEEGKGKGKEEEREESKPRKEINNLEQSKESKQRETKVLNKESARERVPKRDRSPKAERPTSEEKSANRDRSQINRSKEILSSRDKSPVRGVSIKDERKIAEAGIDEAREQKEKEKEQKEKEKEKDTQHLPMINEVIDAIKEKEKYLEKNPEKTRPKGGARSKPLRLPYKGLGTLYGQNILKNQGDQHQKLPSQDFQSPHDYYALDVELITLPPLEVEGMVIKSFREAENQGQFVKHQGADRVCKVEEPSKKFDVEELHKDLHLALIYKTNHNSISFTKKVSFVLECLAECEILTEKQSQTACRILTFIAQSDARGLLTQQFAVTALMKVLNSPNTKSSLRCHIIDIYYMLAKIPGLKAQLLNINLVSQLIKFYFSDLSKHSDPAQNEQILLLTTYCLLTIGKVFNRRAFTSEVFAELEPARYSFISQGGVLAIWLLIHRSPDPELRSFIFKSFFDHVLLEDLEQQLALVKDLIQEYRSEGSSKKSLTLAHILSDKGILPEDNKGSETLPIAQILRNRGERSQREVLYKSEVETRKDTLNLQKETQNTSRIFKLLANAFKKGRLIQEFEEYVETRKEGQFGFDDEDRDKRKNLVIENAKEDDGAVPSVEELENATNRNKKAIVYRLEKKVENTLQKYQLEVNCKQKEIKELLREKELEDKRKQARSLLQQRAEVMRRRNKLEVKKKELQKLALKANAEDKSDQSKLLEPVGFEINIQKATWSALKSYGSGDESSPSPLKPQINGSLVDGTNKVKAKQGSVVLDAGTLTSKATDKPFNIQTDNNTWAQVTSSMKQFGGILAIDSRRGSQIMANESPLPNASPLKSAKGALNNLNNFLHGQNKASVSPRSKKTVSNLTELSKNYHYENVIDDIDERLHLPERSHRASQLSKESPKLPSVQRIYTGPLIDEKLIKSGGLASISLLFENNKKQNNSKGKIFIGKDADRFYN